MGCGRENSVARTAAGAGQDPGQRGGAAVGQELIACASCCVSFPFFFSQVADRVEIMLRLVRHELMLTDQARAASSLAPSCQRPALDRHWPMAVSASFPLLTASDSIAAL